jgi:uncharacterized protein (TIGR03085 family)
VTHAQDERRAICDLLADLGPDKPTLCAGWQTADLAAHLVLRERRPDAGAGVMGGPLAGYTRRVQAGLVARNSFPDLIRLIRSGPPRISLFGLPGADDRLNLVEYFVHHEDVLRAQPGWQPRQISADLTDVLWDRLSLARLMLRKAPVGVELVRGDPGSSGPMVPDGAASSGQAPAPGPAALSDGPVPAHNDSRQLTASTGHGRVRITARARTPVVTVTGDPAELTLWTMGRTGAADVQLDGADADVAALRSDHWRS